MSEQGSDIGSKIAQALKSKGGKPGGNASYTPIMKALGQLGIEPRVMPVMIGDMPIDCLVIPAQELLVKEYAILSGVDPDLLLGDKTPPAASDPVENVFNERVTADLEPSRKAAKAVNRRTNTRTKQPKETGEM